MIEEKDDFESGDAEYKTDGSVNIEAFASSVRTMIDDCDNYINQLTGNRQRALEYYDGIVSDLKDDPDRSRVVSKDLRGEVKKLMPSVMRTFFSNDKIVTYSAISPETEDQAVQATDYINLKVIPECGAENAIHDAIMDAILLNTGILKTCAYTEKKTTQYKYTGQPEQAVIQLMNDSSNEIFDLQEIPETDPDILYIDPNAMRYNFTLRRTEEYVMPCMEAVQRDRFLIYPTATSIKESPIVGEREYVSRSDLVERGYDRDRVYAAAEQTNEALYLDKYSRKSDFYNHGLQGNLNQSQQLILVYTVYVKYDLNNDGVSELYKVVMLDSGETNKSNYDDNLLSYEEVDEVPYFDVKIEREPFQFEGRSLSDDIIDIQLINTSFLRGIMDNTYWQNNQQFAVQQNALTPDGMNAIMNPEFGKPIFLKPNSSAAEALQAINVPFVADKIFPIMQYLDQEKRARTGLTNQSGGLDPDQISNVAASTANIVSEAGLAQSEMMIRTLAKGGIKDAFASLLKLVIIHTNREQNVKINGQWQSYDPRAWNVDMTCIVNVGIGGASKQRALAMMSNILALQEKIFANFGADNPFVKPDQVYNVLEKITEAAGLPSATPYFTRPDPAEIQAKLEAQKAVPSPEQLKMQQEMEIEKYKADRQTDVETAQLIADQEIVSAELQAAIAIEQEKAKNTLALENKRIMKDLSIHNDKMDLEYLKLNKVS